MFAVLVVASACGTGGDDGSGTTATSQAGTDSTVPSGRPPDLVVVSGSEVLQLAPYGYCWSSGPEENRQVTCADGVPPEPLPIIALADTGVSTEFPLPWSLEAQLLPGGEYCNGGLRVVVDSDGGLGNDLGPAGTYRVEVFGRGEEGDAAWAFELVSTQDRQLPLAYAQVLWYPSDRDLESDAMLNVLIGNVAGPPTNSDASVLVTASNGASQQFDLSATDIGSCWESVVGFDADPAFTADTLQLGSAPYELTVTAVIDGSTITSDPVHWPDDFPANSNESRLFETSTIEPVSLSDSGDNDAARVWPPTEPGEAALCVFQYPDDLGDMPIAFDGTVVSIHRGEFVEEAAATPVDLELRVQRAFRGDLGDTVTMHTWDFSDPGTTNTWDPTGIRVLAAASDTLDVMFCGFTRPYSASDEEVWETVFSR